MKIVIIGRTKMLLDSAIKLIEEGHEIPCVITCKGESFYEASEDDFESFAKKIGAKFFCGTDRNRINALLDESRAEVGFSFNWLNILDSDTRGKLKHGIFNAHPGDLPRYQGNACPNWAILNGENQLALCIYQMDDGLDSGNIAMKSFFALDESLSISDFYQWMLEETPKMYSHLAANFDSIIGQLVPQDTNKALRCLPRKPEDSKIEWTSSADSISKLVRASCLPFSGAFGFLESGVKVEVWASKKCESLGDFIGIPGQVVKRSKEGNPIVLCGNPGNFELLELARIGIESEKKDHSEASKAVLSSLRNRLR